MTDKKGKVKQKYEYDSFGNMKQNANKIKQSYTYTGREYDRETGLYYYRARYYDSTVGRFTTEDPILHPNNNRSTGCGISKGNNIPSFADLQNSPQSLHAYIYANNNPVNFTDPTGEFITPECPTCYEPYFNGEKFYTCIFLREFYQIGDQEIAAGCLISIFGPIPIAARIALGIPTCGVTALKILKCVKNAYECVPVSGR